MQSSYFKIIDHLNMEIFDTLKEREEEREKQKEIREQERLKEVVEEEDVDLIQDKLKGKFHSN